MNNIKISPSILSADFSKLGQEIKDIAKAGADLIHIDVMDNHFVPNLTLGPFIVESIRPRTKLPFDIHLMTYNSEKLIDEFAKAGADQISIHPESTIHLDRALEQIKSYNCKAGIALNPSTNPDIITYILDKLDYVLVMTVNPGFAGQSFITSQLEKIKHIKNIASRNNKSIEIAVDGGINDITSKKVIEAGATTLIAGSYIFNKSSDQYKSCIDSLKCYNIKEQY